MAKVNPTPTPRVVCAVGTPPAFHLHDNGCGDRPLSHNISKWETKGTSVVLDADYCAGGDLDRFVFQICHVLFSKAGCFLSQYSGLWFILESRCNSPNKAYKDGIVMLREEYRYRRWCGGGGRDSKDCA